jgi:hypothetical protein
VLITTGAQEIAFANEKRGDFANSDKPMARVRTSASGGAGHDLLGDGEEHKVPDGDS